MNKVGIVASGSASRERADVLRVTAGDVPRDDPAEVVPGKVKAGQGVRQILLTDAPSVLGWAAFRELDARHGLGLLRAGIQAAMDSGAIQAGPVDLVSHMLVAALDEAAMVVGRATEPEAARQDAALIIDRMLTGIAGERRPGS